MAYQLKFTPEFVEDLSNTIRYWKKNKWIGKRRSHKFVSLIHKNVEILKYFPKLGPEISSDYALVDKPTRRLLIGHEYLISYRIDKSNHLIYIGSFFNHHQQNVPF